MDIKNYSAKSGAGTGKEVILSVSGLSKHYKYYKTLFDVKRRVIKAVQGLTFDVFKNEVFAVVGETGCGKSTLAKLITGLTAKTSGEVYFDGAVLDYRDKSKKFRKKIQILFQDPYSSLNPKKKIYRIISYPAFKNGMIKRKERMGFAGSMLKSVGLPEETALYYPYMLSGGQRQRVGIARCLSVAPQLLVLDEPLSALDVSISAQILNLLMEMREKSGMSYIFITHDLKLVRHAADRVCVMYGGRIMEISDSESFFNGPLHPYSKMLYGSMLSFEVKDNAAFSKGRGFSDGGNGSPAFSPSADNVGINVKTAAVPDEISDRGCVYFNRCGIRRDVCAAGEPELKDAGNGRLIACFLPGTKFI